MIASVIALAFQAAIAIMPPAWIEACARHEATHCEMEISPEKLAILNAAVNRMIRFRPDKEGEIESWHVFPEEGDCSDYTLSKREALIAFGMDPKLLKIELGQHYRDEKWRKHAVLRVQLPDRVWILDSVKDEPYQPQNRPYLWRSDGLLP